MEFCYNKGMVSSNYVVIDFETTGLSAKTNEIIQLSALKYEGKKEVARFDQLVKPQRSSLSPQISRLTGIHSSDLIKAPTIDEVFDDYLDFLEDDLLVGHNVSFDMSFLEAEMERQSRVEFFESYDTYTQAQKKMTFLQNYKLSTIKYFFDMNLKSHNALNDCLITARLYQYLEGIK